MAATTMCALALRCTPAARLVARQRRCALALPRRALSSTPARAQSKGEGEEKEKSLQASPQQQRAVAPRGGLDTLPSLGRMNQASRGPMRTTCADTPAPGMALLPPCGAPNPPCGHTTCRKTREPSRIFRYNATRHTPSSPLPLTCPLPACRCSARWRRRCRP